MPRQKRYCPPGIPEHIIQRGNNRQICFACNQDMAAFANWLEEAARKYCVSIHAWVFMTNHVHLLATPETNEAISDMMQYLGRYYVRYFNKRYERTGTLFEGRFKSCLVEGDTYLLILQQYIELNPVRAGMVTDPAHYVWSSYRANALGYVPKIWTPHSEYLALGKTDKERLLNYRSLFQDEVDGDLIEDIRQATNTGLALGSDRFKDEIEAISGKRLRLMKRGPK
jgi:putative transposase